MPPALYVCVDLSRQQDHMLLENKRYIGSGPNSTETWRNGVKWESSWNSVSFSHWSFFLGIPSIVCAYLLASFSLCVLSFLSSHTGD